MSFFEWDDKLSVDIPEIDNQHKKLIAIINLMYQKTMENAQNEAINKIINDLVDYTKYHFSFEEEQFDRIGYPETISHKREHGIFIKKINKYKKKSDAGELILSVSLSEFLKDWLFNHIMRTDHRYKDYFAD